MPTPASTTAHGGDISVSPPDQGTPLQRPQANHGTEGRFDRPNERDTRGAEPTGGLDSAPDGENSPTADAGKRPNPLRDATEVNNQLGG